jgi:hypothetical protein
VIELGKIWKHSDGVDVSTWGLFDREPLRVICCHVVHRDKTRTSVISDRHDRGAKSSFRGAHVDEPDTDACKFGVARSRAAHPF